MIVPRPSTPPPGNVGTDFRATLKTDADRKLFDSLSKNIGGNFAGLGKNIRTASGNANLTDAQALAQKFRNAQRAQGITPGVKPTTPVKPPTTASTLPLPVKPPVAPAPQVRGTVATPAMAGLTAARGPMPTAPVAGPGGGGMGGGPGMMAQGGVAPRPMMGQRLPAQPTAPLAGLRRMY